jgi:thiamine kinase-like enzyme
MSATEEDRLVAHDPTIDDVIERSRLFRGRDVATSLLSGGHMNSAYVVQVGDARYVVRIPAVASELLVPDRANERRNTVAAAASGVSPQVVEYLDDWQVMVLEYVEGETLTDEAIVMGDRIPRVAGMLRTLHAGPRFRTDFDMFRTAERWLRMCDDGEIATPEGLHERMDRVRRAADALAVRPMDSVPSHNDLSADNIIDDGRRLWLIDFEYSGNNDPCYDIADLASQASLDDDRRALLCEAYFGVADPALLARMRLHSTIADVGWAVWASIQLRVSPRERDFAGIVRAFWEPARAMLDSEEFSRLMHSVSGGRVSA